MNKDEQTRAAINAKLIETGEKDRLREMLQSKLIQCGWRDQVKQECEHIVRSKGLSNISIDELVFELVPKSRELVPDHVKKDLLDQIRTFVTQHNDL